MLRRADSLGVFQVESRAQMNMLPRLRPSKFYDLVVQVALVRPGPIQGDMVHPYIRRRWGLEQPEYPKPSIEHGDADEMKRVLGRTLGVPLFQEQAMRVAIVAAGFTPSEADDLRRAMATFKYTQGVGVYRDRLVGGMVRRGYDPRAGRARVQTDRGFRLLRLPGKPRRQLRAPRLRFGLGEVPPPHGVRRGAAEQPADGLLRPGADRARRAGAWHVACGPCDINACDWDSTLEPDARSAEEYALRLGLRLAGGLAEEDGRRIAKVRRSGNGSPYGSVEEVARRADVGPQGDRGAGRGGCLREPRRQPARSDVGGQGDRARRAAAAAVWRAKPPIWASRPSSGSPPRRCRRKRRGNRRCWTTWRPGSACASTRWRCCARSCSGSGCTTRAGSARRGRAAGSRCRVWC